MNACYDNDDVHVNVVHGHSRRTEGSPSLSNVLLAVFSSLALHVWMRVFNKRLKLKTVSLTVCSVRKAVSILEKTNSRIIIIL